MKRILKVVLVLVLLVACGITWFAAQLFWFSPDIVVSKETTWLTETLADDGLPDYAAYLLEQGREGVTPENNGAVPFLRAVWPAGLTARDQKPLCDHLGMEVPGNEGLKQLDDDEELTAKIFTWLEEQDARGEGVTREGDSLVWTSPQVRMEALLAKVVSGPWRRKDCPPLAEWVDQHATKYELLNDAATRPKFYCPPPTLLTQPGDPLILVDQSAIQAMLAARDALAVRSCLYLGEGNVDGSWRDCELLYRLARQIPDDYLIGLLIATNIESTADDLTLAILESPTVTENVASEMLAFQQSRSLRSKMVEAIDGSERLMFITSVMVLARKRDIVAMPRQEFLEDWDLDPLVGYNADWNIVLKHGLEWFDKLVAAARVEDVAERRRRLDQFESELDALRSEIPGQIPAALVSREARSRAMGDILVSLNVPIVTGFTFFSEERCNIRSQLVTLAVGIANYRIKQGEYPESLDQLVPAQFASLPSDIYGHQFVYKQTPQGYLLYSVGVNGSDESGSNEMYSIYQGYDVGEDESLAREALGLPPVAETAEEQDPADLPLEARIPQWADDWSIRLPPRKKPATHRQAGASP